MYERICLTLADLYPVGKQELEQVEKELEIGAQQLEQLEALKSKLSQELQEVDKILAGHPVLHFTHRLASGFMFLFIGCK